MNSEEVRLICFANLHFYIVAILSYEHKSSSRKTWAFSIAPTANRASSSDRWFRYAPVRVVCRCLSLASTRLCQLALCRTPFDKTIVNRFIFTNPAEGAKSSSRKTCLFLSIAKAMVYHHALACISSPKVHIISLRLYFAFAMMLYKAFRFDDVQFLAELMIYTPIGVII